MIATARLDLHPLPLRLIEALLDGDLSRAGALAPFRLDAGTFADDRYVLELRRDQLRADPSQLLWLYRAAVERRTGQVVARGGFHAPPDADGTVEIGYRVHPEHRRRGLARELSLGLLHWARREGAVRCLASVGPDNAASLALVAQLGFVRTGEQVDDVDGLELVHTLELTALPGPGATR